MSQGAAGTAQPGAVPVALRLARRWVWLYRFRTLPFAEWLFSRVACPAIVSCPFAGGRLWVDVSRSSTERLLFLEGERLVSERFLLRSLLAPGMRVADAGGNLGYYALLLAAAVAPAGTVHTFEPEPSNRALLERTVADNGLAVVRVHAVALGAEDGTACLEPGINGQVSDHGPIRVPLRRLDELFPEGVDFLKIDVDGYEGQVLAGARQLLARFHPVLFLELHPRLVPPPYSIRELVGGLAALYPEVELWRPTKGGGLLAKLRARYGSSGVERLADSEAFLAAVEAGRERDTFWAVCGRPPAR